MHVLTWWCAALLLSLAVIKAHHLVISLAVVLLALVAHRRWHQNSPWSGALRISVFLAFFTIAFRVAIALLIGVGYEADPLFSLPRIQLPSWLAGLIIGGPVSLSRISAALTSASVIAAIIIVIGVAQTLSTPRRVLRALPSPFYEFGLVIVIATSLVPQFVESTTRIRRSFTLRGIANPSFISLATPVMEDCLERTLALAASMDARGFGAHRKRTRYLREKFTLRDFALIAPLLIVVILQ